MIDEMKKRIFKNVLELGKLLLIVFIVSLFVRENVVASAYVPTGSMESTVMTGSRVLLNRLSYIWEDPQRGDIVVFYYPDNPKKIYLKRIMGLPGETIEGYNGVVYIDGMPLLKDFTAEKLEQDFGPFQVPEGCYFMMGDNRNDSWDSRYWNNKYVDKKKILGKVSLEYYPEWKRLE